MNHPVTLWPPAGASSTATTIPATDAEALENARKGLEAARIMESQKPPSPPVTAKAGKLVRVNSVPILEAPKTPVEKIHRRSTPTLDAGENQTNGEEASPKELDQTSGSGTKRKKKLKGKKAKKANAASEQPVEEENDANGENTQDDATNEPTGTAVAAPEEKTNAPQQEAPQEQPRKRRKATASKAAAKPPQQTSPQETLGAADLQQAVKQQATPMRSEAADDASKKKANEDNLARASTRDQLPPAQPAADERKPTSGQSGGDLETQLDREVKKEDDGSQSTQPVAPGTEATSKKRKEKTPAQKAAHARYMKFSRSFDRTLS